METVNYNTTSLVSKNTYMDLSLTMLTLWYLGNQFAKCQGLILCNGFKISTDSSTVTVLDIKCLVECLGHCKCSTLLLKAVWLESKEMKPGKAEKLEDGN